MDAGITIRKEQDGDANAIGRVTEAAFREVRYSSHTEQFIVSALRRSNQLTISFVAIERDAIVGHVAISPVSISTGIAGWYGLGPISVLPHYQRRGIGSTLMRGALAELERSGAAGCVVLGDPKYYGRFGFKTHASLELSGVPAEFFQAVSFGVEVPSGTVRYSDAFDATYF